MWQKLKALTFILIFLLLTDFVSAAGEYTLALTTATKEVQEGQLTQSVARASFCKCTCKTNSTIIALDTPSNANNIDPGTSDSTSRDILTGTDAKPVEDDGRPHQRTCADCNRQFCLMYDLPKLDDCKSENRGREDEILATCFRKFFD